MLGSSLPPLSNPALVMLVGFLAYGVSLALFVVGLRHFGTARTGACFSAAPFVGALLALCMGEVLATKLLIAGALMVLGPWLHLTERHEHAHEHQALELEHTHVHDEHHRHEHDKDVAHGSSHRHARSGRLRCAVP